MTNPKTKHVERPSGEEEDEGLVVMCKLESCQLMPLKASGQVGFEILLIDYYVYKPQRWIPRTVDCLVCVLGCVFQKAHDSLN